MPSQDYSRSQSHHESVHQSAPVYSDPSIKKGLDGIDVDQLENVLSEDLKKDYVDYDRVDAEVAKYASDTAVFVSEEDNKRLKRLIDVRVLTIMIFTYFLQALGS